MKRRIVKPYYCLVNVLILALFASMGSVLAETRQDDLELVDRMLEVQPKLDLSKEAELQVKLIERRYGVDVAAVVNGKIKYSLGQKGAARMSFKKISPDSKEFNFMVMSYYRSASSPTVKDVTGIKDSVDLFLENRVFESVKDRNSQQWSEVKEVLDVYGNIYKDNPERIKKLNEIRAELGLDPFTPGDRITQIVNEAEAVFMGDKEGSIDINGLQKILAKLEDKEFDKQDYGFFIALNNRARVLTILGREEDAVKFLSKKEKHIDKFEDFLWEDIKKNNEIPRDQKEKVLKVSSLKAGYHYAMGLALFSKYKKKAESEPEEAKAAFFSKTGAVFHYYICASKFMGSKASFKAILRYDQCREELKEKFDKNLRALAVSRLQVGKSFYTLKYYQKAIDAFKECFEGKENEAFEAMRFTIPSYVELEKLDEAEKVLKLMKQKFAHLNKAPADYINKSGDYLSRKYRAMMYETEDEAKKKEFEKKAREIFLTYCAGDKNPGQASTMLRMAGSAARQARNAGGDADEQYKTAVDLYNKVISLYPSSNEAVSAYLNRGSLHLAFSQLDEAHEDFNSFLKAAPEISDDDVVRKRAAEINLLRIMIMQKDFEEAEKFVEVVRGFIRKSAARNTLRENISGWNEIVDLSEIDIIDSKAGFLYRLIKKKKSEGIDTAADEKKQSAEYERLEKTLKAWISTYGSSENHAAMMARLGGTYMMRGREDDAVRVYENLAKKHPNNEILKQIGINIASAFFENEEYLEGAEAIEKYTDISRLGDRSLYYLVKKFAAAELKPHEKKKVSAIVLECFRRLSDNGFAKDEINKRHELEIIASKFLMISGKSNEALELLKKIAAQKPNGPWIVDVLLLTGACYAEMNNFPAVSSTFGKLRKKADAMEGGAGSLSLKLKVEVEWADALSKAKNPAHLNKGRSLSFLAAQVNPIAVDVKERVYIEKAHYLNVLYAKLTGKGDFKTLKSEFLKKYPATKFAAKVRRL